jgi:hypothetical protein
MKIDSFIRSAFIAGALAFNAPSANAQSISQEEIQELQSKLYLGDGMLREFQEVFKKNRPYIYYTDKRNVWFFYKAEDGSFRTRGFFNEFVKVEDLTFEMSKRSSKMTGTYFPDFINRVPSLAKQNGRNTLSNDDLKQLEDAIGAGEERFRNARQKGLCTENPYPAIPAYSCKAN